MPGTFKGLERRFNEVLLETERKDKLYGTGVGYWAHTVLVHLGRWKDWHDQPKQLSFKF